MLKKLYNWVLAKAAHDNAPWWLAVISFADPVFSQFRLM